MKLSIISLVLSAGFAISQVSAAPLRVVVVSGQIKPSHDLVRVGNDVANPQHSPTIPHVVTIRPVNIIHTKIKVGCAGSLRAKLSKWLSRVFGLPAVSNATASLPPGSPEGSVHKLPVENTVHGTEAQSIGRPNPYYANGRPLLRPHTFVQRLTLALMTLDLWEGRVVSFILGCGLGVLIRMFWVLAVIAIRSLRGKKREEEFLGDEVIFEEEEHLLPPRYVEVKEKSEPVVPERSA